MSPEFATELLQEALQHANGTHELTDVLKAISKGDLKLWAADRSIAVTEVMNFPRKRVVSIFLAGGEPAEIAAHMPEVEAYARSVGATGLMFYGRAPKVAAWAKLFPDFKPAWVCMWKDL